MGDCGCSGVGAVPASLALIAVSGTDVISCPPLRGDAETASSLVPWAVLLGTLGVCYVAGTVLFKQTGR